MSDYQQVRSVSSNQSGIHERLEETVQRHLNTEFRRPFAPHSVDAFAVAQQWLGERKQPLILDSFCGIGESSRWLAQNYPEHAVIGLDQSAHRLDKFQRQFGDTPENLLLLRADCDDFWRQALAAGWRCEQHWLLYPNPWPKSAQLQRRVHGSPLFPTLLGLGGRLLLRSNWRLYLEEFAVALAIAGIQAPISRFTPIDTITAFERKYAGNGQPLWELRAELDIGAEPQGGTLKATSALRKP